MDPLRFNYLLSLWSKINKEIVPQDALDKIEQELSQYVREQKIIDELKIKAGVSS